MGQYFSDFLFHFVGRADPKDHERNYEVLKSILTKGCVSYPPHDGGWGRTFYTTNLSRPLESEEMVVPEVTCYCDIPFEHLSLHLQKYGKFGLSLNKDLLIKFGARPVIYAPLRPDDRTSVHGGHAWLRDVQGAFRGFRDEIYDKLVDHSNVSRISGEIPNTPEKAARALNDTLFINFFAFIKSYNSLRSDDDPNYFYSEREWRKFGNQQFTPENVGHVVVAKDYVNRLQSEFPQYKDRIFVAPDSPISSRWIFVQKSLKLRKRVKKPTQKP